MNFFLPKSIFCNFKNGRNQFLNWGKSSKLPKMQFHKKKCFIWFHEFFCLESFKFSGPLWNICTCFKISGIGDRHNDNIMVKQSGHLFHIDFGKFLGDKQMVGKINRDRTPFVLTPDMIFVINGGNKPSQKFHDFVDLCCKSFNIIRKNGNVLVNFFHIVSIFFKWFKNIKQFY